MSEFQKYELLISELLESEILMSERLTMAAERAGSISHTVAM